MNKTAKEMACLVLAYKQAIAALDSTHFSVESRKYFACSFKKKDEPMTSEALYTYNLDSRSMMSKVCSYPFVLASKLFVFMKSGKDCFHDSCNDMLIKEFRKELALNSKLSLTPQESKISFLPHSRNTRQDDGILHRQFKFFAGIQFCRGAWQCKQHSTILSSSKAQGSETSIVWIANLGRSSIKIH